MTYRLKPHELLYSEADQAYITSRNSLIDEAIKYADSVVKRRRYGNDGAYKQAWDKVYLSRMDEKAAEIGI